MKKLFVIFIALLFSSFVFGITFNFQGIDLKNALQEVAKSFDTTVVTAGNVSGVVNTNFEANDIEEALKLTLLGTNYTFAKVKPGFYLVGNADSSDISHVTLFKTKVIFLKDTYPETVYTLLGSLSKYVVYSPKSMALVVDADEETLRRIEEVVSKVDIPNSNFFFSYEVHELSSDEYERFRQFETLNRSAIMKFSNTSFSIFKEMIKINGESDAYGTVALPKIGELEVSSTKPPFKMNVSSREDNVSVSLQTGGNAIAFEIDPKIHNHVITLFKNGKRSFLLTVNVAKTPKDISFVNEESEETKNILNFTLESGLQGGRYRGILTYGTTDLSIFVSGGLSFPSTQTFSLGMRAKMIENMFGTLAVRLTNFSPSVYAKLEDTTEIGVLRFKASLGQELSLNGFGSLNLSASLGISYWNMEFFGGIGGEWNSPLPFVRAKINFGYLSSTLTWKYTEGYTVAGGVTFTW